MVYHTLTWLAWLCAAAYLTLVNHQPLVSILLIVATAGVFSAAGRRSPLGQSWGAFLRLGLSMWLVALAFNLLSTHAGRIVLLTLPRSWPLVGGPITLEAMLYGLSNGATLFAILLVFAAFMFSDRYLYGVAGYLVGAPAHSPRTYLAIFVFCMLLRVWAAGLAYMLPKVAEETEPEATDPF